MPQDTTSPETILDNLDLPKEIKARAWDAFHASTTPDDLQKHLDALPLPKPAKARLWDAKFSPLKGATVSGTATPAKTVGRQLVDSAVESLPAVGGVAGAALASETGPGAIGGAMAGGVVGRRVEQYIDALRGTRPLPGAAQAIGELGESGTAQGLFQAGGAALSKVATGVFSSLKPSIDAAAKYVNDTYGLKLSAADLMKAGPVRDVMSAIQRGASRSLAGGTIAKSAQRTGSDAAAKAIGQALDRVAPAASLKDAGLTIQAGVKAAKAGTDALGKEVGKVADQAPAVNLQPVKQRALQIFRDEILPTLQQAPLLDVKQASARRAIQQIDLRATPKEFETQVNNLMRSKALDSVQSPVVNTIRRVLLTNDTVDFKVAQELAGSLRDSGKLPDQVLAKASKALSSHLSGAVTDALKQTDAGYAPAAKAYRDAAQLLTRTFLKDSLKNDPESVVKAIGADQPSRVVQARKALLGLAQQGPDAADGQKAWDQLRRTWFDRRILRPALKSTDPAMLAKKIAEHSDVLKEFYDQPGDPAGKAVLTRAKDISSALAKRNPVSDGRLYTILEFGSLAGEAATGRIGAAAKTAAVSEGVPGLVMWAMHSPAATKLLIEGITTKDIGQASAIVARLGREYGKAQSSGSDTAASPTGTP